MNGIKKISIRIFILLYALSYFLQNSFFINRRKIYAAETPNTTNLVAIFVDKDIYKDITTNLIRYSTKYLQKNIDNSKAVILPIDTASLKAHEISQILENIYFEGLENENSKLVGVILIGNIPLPVVENNGFIYPSIYPYVDFEQQQFIYDTNKKFFVYNNNPNGQAEIWHGMIQFDTTTQYNEFFTKIRQFHSNPTDFIDKTIWYDDFIGLKKYFIPENTKYYVNNMTFSEDMGYRRFTPLLLDTLTNEHNNDTLNIGNDLVSGLANTQDQNLKEYASMIETRSNEANVLITQNESNMPTLTLKKSIQEMVKIYDGLISTMFLSKTKDNIASIARRYKNTEGESFTDINGTTDKINQQDNRILGDLDNNIQGLLIQANDYLEEQLNNKIEEEKYYLTIPIPVSYLKFEGEEKKEKCVRPTYTYYHNYYFGRDANFLRNAGDTSIYKGTFQNLKTLSGQNIQNQFQSIGGSYKTFSVQVEANRGYNIGNAEEELKLYNSTKTNKQELRGLNCPKFLFNREGLGICIKKRYRHPNDNAEEDKCTLNNEDEQGGCESLTGFAQRNRGGASPLNLNTDMSLIYDYKNARLPIYDIAGSKAINTAEVEANTASGVQKYATLIQNKLGAGDLQKNNTISYLIRFPQLQGSDLMFTNQYPYGNLKNPTRGYNPPRTYANTDFFNTFTTTTFRSIIANKAIIYNWTPATSNSLCDTKGEIYTYKTLDSRIKNISPTRDQISDTEFYKFKPNSDIWIFYDNVIGTLKQTQEDIVETTKSFSGASLQTGVIGNLVRLKNEITKYNSGMQQIIAYNYSGLIGSSSSQINNLANTWSGNNINQTKSLQISGSLEEIKQGLNSLLNYINTLSVADIQWLFEYIIQSEKYKNQNVEILDTRKTEITADLNAIINNTNFLKTKFTQARGVYNTINQLQNYITALQAKRLSIAGLHLGNGCTQNYYKPVCDVLTNIITTLSTDLTSINEKIDKIENYQSTATDQFNNLITVQPFVEINQEFTSNEIGIEINQIKNKMNSFAISTDPEKKEKNKGMNITTSDRPIDNIRNITFKGIGGDNVRLEYPNLYEVEVYKESNEKLILKTPNEIREAIKKYLINKAIEYNNILEIQKNKKNDYYTSFSAQFTFLGQLDPLANPNTHNYTLLPADFFIKKLVEYFDALENEFGKTYIYGIQTPKNDDEKIDMLAKFLYQKNIAWPEKFKTETVISSINENKASFDINHKINNTTKAYLTVNSDQGAFLTPTYNNKGYEIGFINSDGQDYISSRPIPTFIQQIQNIQITQAETKSLTSSQSNNAANIFIEDPTQQTALQQSIDTCEGVDTKGTSLIFDFKTFSSPWLKAMKCRAQKILEKPFDIQISFKQSLGPVFMGTYGELQNTIENFGAERKKFGDQRTGPDNEDIIAQATGTTQEKLIGYNNYAIINLDKTTINVNDTGTNSISIGTTQDFGNIKLSISAIGDNCFKVTKNQNTLSNNICEKAAEEVYNPYKEQITFNMLTNVPKAGTTSVHIQICEPVANTKNCITKTQVIHTLPGPTQTITITTPDIVMEGSEMPIIVTAQDEYGNSIGKTIESYIISVLTGNGKISNGAFSQSSIEFSDFNKAGFIYQAPTGLTENKGININISKKDNEEKLLTIEPKQIITTQKNIIVAKGIVTISQNDNILYKTTTNQDNNQNNKKNIITFTLPKNEEDVQYIDINDLPQIQNENVPSIRIRVEDPNGNILSTIANITTNNGLLVPGIMSTRTITKGNNNVIQTGFSKSNSFVIQDGTIDIALYPTFKAGEDTLLIHIPGLDPIKIPIIVYAGDPKKVILTLEKSNLDLTNTTGSKGLIQIVDSWNNKVNTPTSIRLGTIGAGQTNTNEFIYSGGEYEYTLTAKSPGGEGYIFAYIKDREISDQTPGYERFITQESILPKENLNVMYLNLFGTDRGNQRGYFSENEKVVNQITSQSNKVIATTTQLIDPSKIKKIEYIIDKNGQITNMRNTSLLIDIENNYLRLRIPDIADISLGETKIFSIKNIANNEAVEDIKKNENMIIYIPEPTDSIITNNTTTKTTININGTDIIDLQKGTIDPLINILATNQKIHDMNTYTITWNEKKIGTLMVWKKEDIISTNIDIKDPITYGKTKTFSEGSTNNEGIGIFIQSSVYTKQGYTSIEDSADAMLGIGFTSDFKNIANFANGKTVGESTLPYGSHFLINFGDPLLQRIDKNPELPGTDFDASIGQTIYSDPNKTLLKVLPIDFNNNGLQDLLVVYTDGTVKLLKNYGGKENYKNIQELMIIAEPIKDIHIGDVDGNKYDDIIIITNNNKGLVYLNDKGIFAVDGKNICLNTNTEPGTRTPNPENFGDIKQFFIEDMDKDGKVDIVTNDSFNDIKIFYGGITNGGPNYLSLTTGTCDANRYQRQKDNYTTIKRFGIRINNNRYIQDESLVHRKDMLTPTEGKEEEKDEPAINTSNYNEDDLKKLKDQSKKDVENFTENIFNYVAEGAKQLAYIENPIDTLPIYETTTNIYYLPINESNDTVSIYKEYNDINGGILKNGDEVVVHTTLIAKKNNTKITYLDTIKGPREIKKDKENKITSLVFTSGNTGGIKINRNVGEEYQFMMDNIQLSSGDKLSFSYIVSYQQQDLISIDIEDIELIKANKQKDNYPDILFTSTDSCQKGRWILFNDKTGQKKTYEEIFDDIQKDIDDYMSGAQNIQTEAINEAITQLTNIDGIESLSNIKGMSESLETREPINMLTPKTSLTGLLDRAITQGGTINIDTNFIDSATSKVSKKIDEALEGMCKGFTLGKGASAGCQGVPIPFNQAFLAPGNYHLFGCVPGPTHPLYIPFKTLNQTLGKGLPVLAFPTTSIIPIRPPSPIEAGGIFGGSTSQFRLYIAPTLTLGMGIAMCFGPYSIGTKIPKPFADMGGNCIVFAFPPITKCPKENIDPEYYGPRTNIQSPSFIHATKNGACNTPPKTNKTIVTTKTGPNEITETINSPFEMVSAGTSQNNESYSAAIPQGNFGGLIQIDQDPITTTSVLGHTDMYDGYELKKGEPINLKIIGAKTKGLVQCIVDDRFTRQIQYIQNNLTKMTIQLDLPDITTIFQGFDKIGNLTETYKNINTEDIKGGYIKAEEKESWTDYVSKQQFIDISQQIGQNPFEAIQKIFKEVPLVHIDTKDINIKIPAITTDDIKKYQSYLTLRAEKAAATSEERGEFFKAILPLCNTDELKEQMKDNKKLKEDIKKIEAKSTLTEEDKAKISELQELQRKVEICLHVTNKESASKFLSFQENTAGLIRSIKQNINALEKYKEFPTQLHERTHLSDRYLTELSAVLGEFLDSTTYRLNTNANRFSSYVDAIITLIGIIDTWQTIIDFSVNRSEKCSKCSNDNYGSFSCSLSFLCPQLPIFPIPGFKIPNIYMDMSHIELGMNIILPKINFVPIKIPLPQIPNIPEPPTIEVNRDILFGLNINFFEGMSMPTIPVIPNPPRLPEPPSFIPSIKIDLPVLPPAPKIPKILPEISATLKIAEFIGKVFCIVKGGIGLVGEMGVKGKIEQMTQRTWDVPIFDFFDLTMKYKDPPLQGFDYKIDAYTTLKFNFDGVYDVLNNIAKMTNTIVSQTVEAPIQKAIEQTTETIYETTSTGFEFIENLDQNINFNGYNIQEETNMIDYRIAKNELKGGLMYFQNNTLTDKVTKDRVVAILGKIENTPIVSPATTEIQYIKETTQGLINEKIQENKNIQENIKEYEKFIDNLKENKTIVVNDTTTATTFTTPLLTVDSHTKQILQSQEDPTKTYLDLNKKMVEGYIYALNTDGPEKLNMTQTTYQKSKKYLETTKENIDTALLAYGNQTLLTQSTCTNCGNNNGTNNYNTDISAYVKGIFIESSDDPESMINTVSSEEHVENIGKKYITTIDINNDKKNDIIMYDTNTITIKYANQEDRHFSKGGNTVTKSPSGKFYSYAKENTWNRYITSLDQLHKNSDAYGYVKIDDIKIKLIEKNKEVKNFRTNGQTFNTLQISWKNNNTLGEKVDGYIIKINNKIDEKDTPSSFRDFLGINKKPKYILILPKDTDYTRGLLTVDKNLVKRPINIETKENIVAIEYYDPEQDTITTTFKELPRERLYTSIATLTITQEELTSNQQKSLTLYKKSSPRSNQTVAGMQNIGDISAPEGEIVLRRNITNEAISTGTDHEGYINTRYTLKSFWTDNVIVSKMIVQKDGQTILEKSNDMQTGTLDIGGLYFTGTDKQIFDFIAIDQNNNIAKERVTLTIKIPDIEVIDVKKTGEETADIVAEISNDIDEGMVVFQRMRNDIRKDIGGTNQNIYGGFNLSPKQTIVTGNIFTMGNKIGLYDNIGNEVAIVDPETGEIIVYQEYENKIKILVNFKSHIPAVEIRDIVANITLFQIVLPIESIVSIDMHQNKPMYEQVLLPNGGFDDFNNGYCIKNIKNDCILFTNNKGAIYMPGIYAVSLQGTYEFDKTNKNIKLIINDQSNKAITTLTVKIKTGK